MRGALLHGGGSIGWHDWPWFVAFAAAMLLAWVLLQALKRRARRRGG